MSWHEDPDRALARWQAEENERYERQQREDRIADYTPRLDSGGLEGSGSASQDPGHRAGASDGRAPSVTGAMVALAWTHLNGSWHDARDAGRALAELVLEAGDEQAT